MIETERLAITEFTMDMAPDICGNSQDEDNRKFVPDEVFETVADAEEALSFLISQYGGADGPLAYAVLSRADGSNIGYVQLVPIGGGNWEIGYHIAKRFTGRGYATEALTTVLEYLTKNEGISCVTAWCAADNIGSHRVLEKSGMQLVRTEENGLAVEDKTYDKLVFEYRG